MLFQKTPLRQNHHRAAATRSTLTTRAVPHVDRGSALSGVSGLTILRLQSEIQRFAGMQQGGVEEWQVAVLRLDEQRNLRASKDDPFCAAVMQSTNDFQKQLPGTWPDLSPAQFLIDHFIHPLLVIGFRNDRPYSRPFQPFAEESLAHGEDGSQQPDALEP